MYSLGEVIWTLTYSLNELFQANVMKFKSRYLQPVKATSSEGGVGKEDAEERNGFHATSESAAHAQSLALAYRYPEAFTVDLENGCVRFGFRCLIPGSEGAGTEFLYFDTAGRVSTEIHLMVRSRFGELCSCCCLPALPGPAWVLLN